MTPDVALIAARFVHYAAVLSLFGLSCFPFAVSAGPTGVHEGGTAYAMAVALRVTAMLAVASGLVVFVCVASSMVGSWHDLDGSSLASVATTAFGYVWIAHVTFAVAALGLTLRRTGASTSSGSWWLLVVSGLALATLAGVGHTQDGGGATKAVHVLADALHLLGAGGWLGGIFALFILIAEAICSGARGDEEAAITASARFAGLGSVAVATLTLSGIVNGWLLVGSIRNLVSSAYGQLLLIKVALFAAMLGLAALNRYRIVPALLAGGTDARTAILGRLRRHVLAEQVLGLVIILIVSALGTMEPAVNLRELS